MNQEKNRTFDRTLTALAVLEIGFLFLLVSYFFNMLSRNSDRNQS